MALSRNVLVVLGLALFICNLAGAQTDQSELVKTAQNPIADLASLPLQTDIHQNVGNGRESQTIFTIEPVIPYNLNDGWNVITRTRLPVVSQPWAYSLDDRKGGIGDLMFTAFFTPMQTGKWIWGIGPVLTAPTGTHSSVETDQWTIGPAAAVLTMDGPWVYGLMVNNIVDFAGDGDMPGVNRMQLQPFVNYNFGDDCYLVSSPEISANWEGSSGNTWTIPLGAGIGKIFNAGDVPINASIHYYYNIENAPVYYSKIKERPIEGADWTLRVQFQFFFDGPSRTRRTQR